MDNDKFLEKIKSLNFEIFQEFNGFHTGKSKEEINLYHKIGSPSIIGKQEKKSILVINMNPGDLNDDIAPIGDEILTIPSNNIELINHLKSKNLIYPKFYDKIYDLFDNVKLFWSTDDNYLKYVNTKIDDTFKNEFKILFELEREKRDRLIIFTELFYQHGKKQKNITNHFDKKYDSNIFKVKDILDTYIDYYNPYLILITNATASKIIYNALSNTKNKDIDIDEYHYNGINIMFSGMITGGRALDNGSYYRLKNKIYEYLSKK